MLEVYIALAILFATPLLCLTFLSIVKGGVREAFKSLRDALIITLLFIPAALYSIVGIWLKTPTTHPGLAALSLALLIAFILLLSLKVKA